MINLLPLEEKEKLILKKKEKLAAIWGIVVLVCLVCLVLVLLSIKFYILSAADYQKNILEQAQKDSKTADFISMNSVIKKYNGTLNQVDSFYKKETYFNQALEVITNTESPKGLYLTNFSLSRSGSGAIVMSVSGTSDTRDNLLAFKKNVEGNKEIINPYFSPESWVNPKNVNFSLTFQVKPNGQ